MISKRNTKGQFSSLLTLESLQYIYQNYLKESGRGLSKSLNIPRQTVGRIASSFKSGKRICKSCKDIADCRPSAINFTDYCLKHQPANVNYSSDTDKNMEQSILKLLQKNSRASLSEISLQLDIGIKSLKEMLSKLYTKGYNIRVNESIEAILLDRNPGHPNETVVDVATYFGKTIKFGAVSDNHLNSIYSREDVLNTLYDIYAKEGVKAVYQGGNIIDGRTSFNQFEVKYWSLEDQIKYLIDNYPQRSGIITYFVTGDDHEGWWVQREGIDVGRKIQLEAELAGRHDLKHLGYIESDITLKAINGKSMMRLTHGGGGGAYATSYSSQKMVESFQGGEKPRVLLIGHYHKFDFSYPREVYTVQLGTTEDQTRFMRKNKLQAHLGGCLIELSQDDKGIINRCKVEFIPFYDKEFYKSRYPILTNTSKSLNSSL